VIGRCACWWTLSGRNALQPRRGQGDLICIWGIGARTFLVEVGDVQRAVVAETANVARADLFGFDLVVHRPGDGAEELRIGWVRTSTAA
jgi:hypothetical protein